MDAGLSGLSASEKLAWWGNDTMSDIWKLTIYQCWSMITYVGQLQPVHIWSRWKWGKNLPYFYITPILMEWVALPVSIKWNAVAWLELYPFHLNLFKEGARPILPEEYVYGILVWVFGSRVRDKFRGRIVTDSSKSSSPTGLYDCCGNGAGCLFMLT